jgi:hypothetical protein
MPFFDQPATPGRPSYKNEVVQRWTAAIAQSDGFVFVTPQAQLRPLRRAQERDQLGHHIDRDIVYAISRVARQQSLWRCRTS